MTTTTPLELNHEWPLLLEMLPDDLDRSAKEFAALRRKREIPDAQALLRLILAYAIENKSLRSTADWARLQKLADISNVAVLKRLRNAAPWLGHLLAQLLLAQPNDLHGLQLPHLHVIDATNVARPGAKGSDWRLHLSFDLLNFAISDVQLDLHGGETLTRHQLRAGQLNIVDRGYAQRGGIFAAVQANADVLGRLNLQNVPLQQRDGGRFDILAHLRELADAAVGDWAIATVADVQNAIPAIAGRLIALPKSALATERERKRIRARAGKQGRTPDPATLEAAGYIMLFTTLSSAQLSGAAALALYRFRWQVELAIKRLKSIIELDELEARSDSLGRTYLLSKMLLALLLERMGRQFGLAGGLAQDEERPVSEWRLWELLKSILTQMVVGVLSYTALLVNAGEIGKGLRDTPRRRVKQSARIPQLANFFGAAFA